MLTHLSVTNYTLVEHIDLELETGLTVITGETGAGKSILLDALSLTLGDRADADRVRSGAKRAEIHAIFDIRHLPDARQWLAEQDLAGESEQECLLRRVITAEGRSRGYINGQPVTLGQLKALGQQLIDIHAQHEHQALLRKGTPRKLLDEYADHHPLTEQVAEAYHHWQASLQHYQQLRDNAEETSARIQLLSYQVEELDQLALQPDELPGLEAEQKQLANGEAILRDSHQLVQLCGEEEQGIVAALNRAVHLAQDLPQDIAAIAEANQLLSSAQIQVEEALRGVERHIDDFQLDPERLQEVEERLSAAFEIARKHRVRPEALVELHETLRTELAQLAGADGDLDQLHAKVEQQETDYRTLAQQLSDQRRSAAVRLAKAVNSQLRKLAMEHAKLEVALPALAKPNAQGLEEVQLLISTNPGQPLKPLNKIASGGELSRVSLAIQVVTAQSSATPTLVFDEVDVGIGGTTADTVGQLLRQLGSKAQVLCVTHLAQVAGKAHCHLRVDKFKQGSQILSRIERLNEEEQIEAIARMMGNDKMTQASLEHAREMITT